MSLYKQSRSLPRRFRLVLASFLQRRGLPFADALPEEAIQAAFDDEDASFADEEEDAVYTPAVTLWAFLTQVLFKDEQRSCVAAVARVVVLLSLATGMLKDMAMGPYTGKETGETALLRQLLDRFEPGDILLADRYFCSYFIIALLKELGIDFVARVHQPRALDFRRGRRLGRGDHIAEWKLPQRPKWMDQQAYDRMPASIEVRQIHVHVGQPSYSRRNGRNRRRALRNRRQCHSGQNLLTPVAASASVPTPLRPLRGGAKIILTPFMAPPERQQHGRVAQGST